MELYQPYRYIFKGVLSDDIEDNTIIILSEKLPSMCSKLAGCTSARITIDLANLVFLAG